MGGGSGSNLANGLGPLGSLGYFFHARPVAMAVTIGVATGETTNDARCRRGKQRADGVSIHGTTRTNSATSRGRRRQIASREVDRESLTLRLMH
jgi:hypothetical protein